MRKISTRLALLALVATAVTGVSIAYGAIVDESKGYLDVCVNNNRGVMKAYDQAVDACNANRETAVKLATLNAALRVKDSEQLDGLDSTDFLRAQTEGRAGCSAGDRLVSGGYVFADPGTFITGSFPSFTSEEWIVFWENDATPDSIRVFALCANQFTIVP